MAGTLIRFVCVECAQEVGRSQFFPSREALTHRGSVPYLVRPEMEDTDGLAMVRAHRDATGHALYDRRDCISLENEASNG